MWTYKNLHRGYWCTCESSVGFGLYWIYLFIFNRFVNGFREELSVKSGSKDMGSIGQFEFSNYTLFPEGKWVSSLHHTPRFVPDSSVSELHASCLSLCGYRASFIISGSAGQCEYSMDLGFGSSYTLLIPNTFTFGSEVTSQPLLLRNVSETQSSCRKSGSDGFFCGFVWETSR